MKIFEDLIEELKEENLLEDTIFEINRTSQEPRRPSPEKPVLQPYAVNPAEAAADAESDEEIGVPGANEQTGYVEEIQLVDDVSSESPEPYTAAPVSDPEPNRVEFYRKKAMEEVSSLQMVEHVFSGIEREHLKVTSVGYDDLEVKKALHRFMQLWGAPDSEEHREAEFSLLRETEAWCTALSERDERISVSNLRRFCENSRPVLSSQALMALARFYRNAPFSELARQKFEYVMTRLFSRELGDEKRKLLFSWADMLGHISTLYSNWSSLAALITAEQGGTVDEQASVFSAFANEAESAGSLEQLFGADIFERVRKVKEDLADVFYDPKITAAAIDCNIRLGNRFVDLVHRERAHSNFEAIEEKYGYSYDQVVSNAAGKTLQLLELLKSATVIPEPAETRPVDERPAEKEAIHYVKTEAEPVKERRSLLDVNRWLLAATILTAIASSGLYFWANNYETSQEIRAVAADIDLKDSGLENFLRNGKKTSETFYGVTTSEWDSLDEKAKKDVLQRALTFGRSKGANKVHFLNIKGRTVGFASNTKVEAYTP